MLQVPTEEAAVVVAEEEPGPAQWTCEPATLQELNDSYVVETKMPARDPGATLYLTSARKRDGTMSECQPNQKFKLFLAPSLQLRTVLISLLRTRRGTAGQPR